MFTIKMYNANDFKTKVIMNVLYILHFVEWLYWSMDIRDNKNNDMSEILH